MHKEPIRFNQRLTDVSIAAGHATVTSSSRPAAPAPPDAEAVRAVQAAATQAALRERVARLLESITEQISEYEERRSQSLEEMQQLTVELAFAVAERLLRRAVAKGDYPVHEMVREILDRAESASPVTLRLHPEDVRDVQQAATDTGTAARHVEFVSDAAVPRGGCRAECDGYELVSRLELELQELRFHTLRHLEDAQIERRQTADQDSGVRRYPDRREAP